MSAGNYGLVRPADVSLNDIEVFLHYTPSRNLYGDTTLTRLDTYSVLETMRNPNNSSGLEIFGGMYTLKLPKTFFGQKGIYSIMIKPREIRLTISDTGVLTGNSDVKGLIFNTSAPGFDQDTIDKFQNGNMVGYRIEYLNNNGSKINNLFRIITSNNRVDAVNVNSSNSSEKTVAYSFNDNSSLVFMTVTPSSTSSIKPNVVPFIGNPNQDVILTNTFFNPVFIEVEMVEYDIDSIATGMFGAQSKSLSDGVSTIYNFDDSIYKQFVSYEIQDEFTGEPLYEVREPKTDIDDTKNLDNITEI